MKQCAKVICIILLCQLIGLPVCAQELSNIEQDEFYRLKIQIEAHFFSYDKNVARSLVDQAQAQIEKYPDAWYPHYYAGLINIKLGNIIRAHSREAAYDYYREALRHLQLAHERSPGAETTIVLADAYGKLASLKTLKMFYYGSKSKSYLMDAFDLSRQSPKNYLLAGIEIMWTPRIFGGSKKRAREFFNQALALEPQWRETDRLIVRWASPPEIFAHLAQLEILSNAPVQAQHYINKALAQIPHYDFVFRDIIPQLE